MEESKGNSTAAEQYFDYIIDVMRGNEYFLCKNAKESCDEVIELINDAIYYVVPSVRKAESTEDYVRRSMAFFLLHILMPFSYAIYVDLLVGNIPACFMELRLILESLAKCYLADSRYANRDFFEKRMKLLQGELERERVSISKLMKQLGQEVGLESDFVALWGKLSQDWIHTKGIVDKVVNQLIEKSGVPPWALVIPMYYTEDDLDTVGELRKRISQFRSLLTATVEKYQQELGFYDLGQPWSDNI